MKILILTQPLRNNYGGLLQAFALQTVLKKMGHKVLTEEGNRIKIITADGWVNWIKSIILYGISKYNLLRTVYSILPPKYRSVSGWHTLRFIRENMETIDLFKGKETLRKRDWQSFDAIIVGSDQVWRPAYSNVPTYLLDFTEGMNIKRIAYAASFGIDNMSEFSPDLIARTAILAKQFDAISVREKSGETLCKEYWNVDALQLLDPTLLLDTECYIDLIRKDKKYVSDISEKLFVYLLDYTDGKKQIQDKIVSFLHIRPFEIFAEEIVRKKSAVLPPVTQWLKCFADAEFILTDSFHGTVFAILFKKPFIVVGNVERGLDRFISLLDMFDLKDRLISSPEQLDEKLLTQAIDFQKTDRLLEELRKQSVRFLETNLSY